MEMNWQLIIIQLVNFLIFFLILFKLLYKPIKKILLERKEKIQADLDFAARSNEEAKRLVEEQKTLIKETQEKTESVLKNAVEQGKETAEHIVKEAKEHSALMMANARKDIEDWKKKTISEIEKLVWETSIEITGKIIKTQLEQEKLKKDLNSEVVGLLEEKLRLKDEKHHR